MAQTELIDAPAKTTLVHHQQKATQGRHVADAFPTPAELAQTAAHIPQCATRLIRTYAITETKIIEGD